jgi:twinkle protein
MEHEQDSEHLYKEGCDNCGSSDAKGVYSDGHTFCFSCETYTKGETTTVETKQPVAPTDFKPLQGEHIALAKRSLTLETSKFWDYRVTTMHNKSVQVASYKDAKGNLVGQKLRFANKDFSFLGNTKKATLFGQHLWRDGGKMVVITEGEIDAMSLSQCLDHRYPVVSVITGAQGAKRDIQRNLEWLEKFDSVIFMFDNDEHGVKAAQECSLILSPGKAKIAKLPLKDANEMLVNGRVKELLDAQWNAKPFRPDGIVSGDELWELVSSDDVSESVPYPYHCLNEKTHGIRKGEIVTVTAGSGIGKSALTREIAFHLIKQGYRIGYIALEESVKRTALGLMGLELNKPIHLSTEGVTKDDLRDAYSSTLGNGLVYLYDHWGSTDSDNLLQRIRYLVRGCGCDYIFLDHLSIVVSGMDGGDERRLIDNTMTKLRTLTEEVQCGMVLVSHLKRPSGDKGHEEGALTSLAQLRGSAAIAQLSDMVIGLERNQQDLDNPNLTTVRILKNRWTGETGVACHLTYSKETGRMTETIYQEEDGEIEF